MKRHLLSASVLLLTSAFAVATPVVSGVSGTIADDNTVTISGSGFGSNSLKQMWWGGASGVVDAVASGTRLDSLNLAGISLLTPSTSTYPHVTTERSWSHGKSAAFDVRNTTEYKQTFFFDIGGSSGYSSLYTNAMVYLQHDDLLSGSYLQWKMMRWVRTQTVVDGDGAYMSNRLKSSSFFSVFNSSGQTTTWFGDNGLPGRGAWYRYETWLKLNTASGKGDGVFHVKVTNPSTGAVVNEYNYSNIMFNGSGNSGNFRYYVLQNYFGNAADGGYNQAGNGNAVAWWDDVYMSQSQARVEVCSASTWDKCTSREIQPASAWSDGSVTVKLNKGNQIDFSNAYLYIVDANGAVNSNGYKLSGGTSAAEVAPAPPSNLTATPQ